MYIGDRIRKLRNDANISQSELAKMLGTSRASVNAWEQGFSAPQAAYIIQLSKIFHCSSDYILCIEADYTLNISGFTEEEKNIIYSIVIHFDRAR